MGKEPTSTLVVGVYGALFAGILVNLTYIKDNLPIMPFKTVALFLTVSLLFGSASATTQQTNDLPDTIRTAIEEGNAKDLAAHFNVSLKLVIKEKEGVYSKNQAEQILKSFFETNVPRKFTIKHSGENKEKGIGFAVGSLETAQGPFRITLLLQKQGESLSIHQLRIEEDNG